ncbi:hypothetical protein Patl1_15515 [Pistacia atlantica]|uniref:Uncharacterized protein n=1 Tax=Pistacia atlantica TaxID=434234 RepID=A0ACC1B6C6_9ROSI|nr:hypothetical protein Patl1_15515 [Pistacia atlantica]
MASSNVPISSTPVFDGIVSINAAAQLPLKLTSTNFPSWKAQFDALLIGYNLMGYLDGTTKCPSKDVAVDGKSSPNPEFGLWIRQDKLLLHAILASLSESVVQRCATAQSSREAWVKLHKLFANKSKLRVMNLKEKLTNISCDTQPVIDYLQEIKSVADKLAVIDAPLSDDDLTIFTLNGLGNGFKEISAAIRARDNSISFEELHYKLVEHEVSLKREENHSGSFTITINNTQTTGNSSNYQPCNDSSQFNDHRRFNNRNFNNQWK